MRVMIVSDRKETFEGKYTISYMYLWYVRLNGSPTHISALYNDNMWPVCEYTLQMRGER